FRSEGWIRSGDIIRLSRVLAGRRATERALDAAVERPVDDFFGEPGGVKQPVQLHARLDAHGVEHRDEVLGGDVARGARRIGATAEAAHRAVELAGACLNGGDYVCQRHAARIVKMQAQWHVRKLVEEFNYPLEDLARIRDSDRVRSEEHTSELQSRFDL